MPTFWFAIVSVMLAIYVVLDGYDFGVGVIHKFVARTDAERRTVIAAIGPYWDGNEVWLLAAGGLLFCAFPHAYAASFSGFYLPLIIVLWLLIMRGTSIEFRSHHANPLWREFWDTIFAVASALMALVLGTSLGNVIRGVPIDETGYFAIPLFTNFLTGMYPGVFDWYTILVGLLALSVLAVHGSLYLVWKTTNLVQERSRKLAAGAWWAAFVLWLAATGATIWIQPELFQNLLGRPWSLILVGIMLAGGAGSYVFMRRQQDLAAFISSSLFIIGILAATMAGNYPYFLRSTIDPYLGLTAHAAASGEHGLRVALAWWIVGMTLVLGYFFYLFRTFRGKARVEEYGG
jgi:cytochrome d ubiquinol oxidase subunit II